MLNYTQQVPRDQNSRYLSFAENERLQLSTEIVDAELDGVLARVQGNLELRALSQVTNSDNVPGCLWGLPCTESANERKLLRKALRENVPVNDSN